MAKKYLLSMNNTQDADGIHWAFIDMHTLQPFIATVREASVKVASLAGFHRVSFFNYSPVYLQTLPESLQVLVDTAADEDGFVEILALPDDTPVPEADVRVNYSLLNINNTDVLWECMEKYSDVTYESAPLKGV